MDQTILAIDAYFALLVVLINLVFAVLVIALVPHVFLLPLCAY